MRASEFLSENKQTPAQAWIARVYDQYQDWPYGRGDKVMVWGSGDDQQFAVFALKPKLGKPNTVDVDWFQAHPQRQGVGSRAMQELKRLAQESGIQLTLMPWDKGQVSQAALKKFYKKAGFTPIAKGATSMQWSPEQLDEISDERLQSYLSRAGKKVDSRLERMARARDRLNKGYEIYHAKTPDKVVDRFEANTPAEAQRYYADYIADYDSDEDYDLRLRRATGIMESTNKQATAQQVVDYINQTHHEPLIPKLADAVLVHPQWELVRVPLLNLNIPDEEYDDVDYDEYEPEMDPYGRVMTVEPEHAGEVSQHLIDKKPIVIDADRYIIDGNHRAWAAKNLLKRDYIMAWRPIAVNENFADGKVKGKSRPGRVKRAGASCAGSVTDLRAKAKKYGGERGKMYHWCANMKGGRKKAK